MKVRELLGGKLLSDYKQSSDESGWRRQAICNLCLLLKCRIPDENLPLSDNSSLSAIADALEKLDVGFAGYDQRDFADGIRALRELDDTQIAA